MLRFLFLLLLPLFLRAGLGDSIHLSQTEENLIDYLHIDKARPIDQSTYLYVKFALESFVKKKVSFVLFDIDTPGGEVFSSLQIVELLHQVDVQHRIPVIAFIDDWAVSAGAMLAYACRFIVVLPHSIMGAAEPVFMGQGGQMVSASEKVNSALRAQFATLAAFYGRDPLIAEAMVDKDLTLVWRNGSALQLQGESQIRPSDRIITQEGKLLTLKGSEMMELGVSEAMAPLVALPPITEREREAGAWSAKKSLLFQLPTFKEAPDALLIDYKDWRLTFFSFLSRPFVATLLLIGLILGIYIELNTPGFGFPGGIAALCLFFILLSSFAIHAVHWIEIILLCLGFVLIALEFFVIPGFGVAGGAGIILTIIALFALMLPRLSHLKEMGRGSFLFIGDVFMERLAYLFSGVIIASVGILFLVRFFSRHSSFSKLVLKGEQDKEAGFFSGIPRSLMPDLGAVGRTVTPLRPSGKVAVGERLFNAAARQGYIESGKEIEVFKVEGSKVIVKEREC